MSDSEFAERATLILTNDVKTKIPGDSRSYLCRYSLKDRRSVVYCCESRGNMTCSFSQRKDRFCEHWRATTENGRYIAKYQSHVCEFVENNSRGTLHAFLERKSTDKITEINKEIQEMIAQLVGVWNVSLSCACSPLLWNIMEYCFHVGQQNPKKTFERVFEPISRFKSRSNILSYAQKIREEEAGKFAGAFYSSLAMDEGKTLGQCFLNFVLHNTAMGLREFCVQTVLMEGQKCTDYAPAIVEGLQTCIRLGISISTIVVDQGPGQRKALDPKWNGSIHHRTNIPMIRQVIPIPCVCHKINNMYKKVCEEDPMLQKLVAFIRTTAKTLKESKDPVLSKCPQFIATRWLYDLEIFLFIQKHFKDIKSYLWREKQISLPKEIHTIRPLLVILRSLIEKFESGTAKLEHVWPCLEAAIPALKEAGIRTRQPHMYASVIRKIKNEILKDSGAGGIYLLAYLLTPAGMAAYGKRTTPPFYGRNISRLEDYGWRKQRAEMNGEEEDEDDPTFSDVTSEGPDIIHMESSIPDAEIQQDDDLARVPVHSSCRPTDMRPLVVDGADVQSDSDLDQIQVSTEQASSSASTNASSRAQTRSIDDPERPDQMRILQTDLWNEYMIEVDAAVDFIAACMCLNDKATERLKEQFDAFLSDAVSKSLGKKLRELTDVGYYNWESLLKYEEYRLLADLALRLRPTPASEASAERAISRERLIVVSRRNRAKSPLIDARVVIMSAGPEIEKKYGPHAIRDRCSKPVFEKITGDLADSSLVGEDVFGSAIDGIKNPNMAEISDFERSSFYVTDN